MKLAKSYYERAENIAIRKKLFASNNRNEFCDGKKASGKQGALRLRHLTFVKLDRAGKKKRNFSLEFFFCLNIKTSVA